MRIRRYTIGAVLPPMLKLDFEGVPAAETPYIEPAKPPATADEAAAVAGFAGTARDARFPLLGEGVGAVFCIFRMMRDGLRWI